MKILDSLMELGAKIYLYPIYSYYRHLGGPHDITTLKAYFNSKDFDSFLLKCHQAE